MVNLGSRWLRGGLSAVSAVFLFPSLLAADELQDLRRQLAVLEGRIATLENERAEQAKANVEPTATVPDKMVLAFAGREGFGMRSGDGNFELRLGGVIQVDARWYVDRAGLGGGDSFLLRRVRPILNGRLYDRFTFRLMPDFAGSAATLVDAYLDYRISDTVHLQVGKFKVPVDLERVMSQTNLLFVERGSPTNLAPNRDIGIQVYGSAANGRLDWALGLTNGVPDGGTSVADDDRNKDVFLRLFSRPFRLADHAWRGLGFGIAGTWGHRSGVAVSSYKTNAQQTLFRYQSGATLDGITRRIEPQVYYYRGPIGLMGSWIQSQQSVRAVGITRTLTHRAWQVAGSWVLTGEDAAFGGVRPKADFDPASGKWGAVELALRYGEITFDRDSFPTFADPARSAVGARGGTVGVNWILNRSVKLVADYEWNRIFARQESPLADRTEQAVMTRLQLSY